MIHFDWKFNRFCEIPFVLWMFPLMYRLFSQSEYPTSLSII